MKAIFLQQLGNFIREHRLKAKKTQARLAEDINISEEYVSQIERGEKSPSFLIIFKMSYVLDFELNDINTYVELDMEAFMNADKE